MPLELADFPEIYRDCDWCEETRREHFAVFSSVLECIALHFASWGRASANTQGITSEGDSPALVDDVELNDALRTRFNRASGASAAGRERP